MLDIVQLVEDIADFTARFVNDVGAFVVHPDNAIMMVTVLFLMVGVISLLFSGSTRRVLLIGFAIGTHFFSLQGGSPVNGFMSNLAVEFWGGILFLWFLGEWMFDWGIMFAIVSGVMLLLPSVMEQSNMMPQDMALGFQTELLAALVILMVTSSRISPLRAQSILQESEQRLANDIKRLRMDKKRLANDNAVLKKELDRLRKNQSRKARPAFSSRIRRQPEWTPSEDMDSQITKPYVNTPELEEESQTLPYTPVDETWYQELDHPLSQQHDATQPSRKIDGEATTEPKLTTTDTDTHPERPLDRTRPVSTRTTRRMNRRSGSSGEKKDS